MSLPFAPPCPRCGKTEVEVFSQSPLRGAQGKDGPVNAIHYVFQCQCGLAFTQTVNTKQPPPEQPTREMKS